MKNNQNTRLFGTDKPLFTSMQNQYERQPVQQSNRASVLDFTNLIRNSQRVNQSPLLKNKTKSLPIKQVTVSRFANSNVNNIYGDYQQPTVSQLPKIQQKLLDIQNIHYKEYLQTTQNTSRTSVDYLLNDPSATQQLTTQSNQFYTAYNFRVLHSSKGDFDGLNTNEFQGYQTNKKLQTVLNSGGADDNEWPIQKSVVDNTQLKSLKPYESLMCRPPHNQRSVQKQSHSVDLKTANPYETSKTVLKLKKFENLMDDSILGDVQRKSQLDSSRLIPIKNRMMQTQNQFAKSSNEQRLFKNGTKSTLQDTSLIYSKEIEISKFQNLSEPYQTQSLMIPSSVVCQLKQQLGDKQKVYTTHKKQQKEDMETQLLRREANLKKRPKFRTNSAKVRTKQNESKMLLQNSVLNTPDINYKKITSIYESKQISQISANNPCSQIETELKPETQCNNQDQKVNYILKPRIGQLTIKPEMDNFKEQLGQYQFDQMLQHCQNEQDRVIINRAYKEFMRVLLTKQQKDSQKNLQNKNSQDQESDQSMILEEDGGPRIECQELVSNDHMLGKFVKAISKKLKKYTNKLSHDLENAKFAELTNNLNIISLQNKLDAVKLQQQKRMPIQGDDTTITALEQIYLVRKKEKSAQIDATIGLRMYTQLLQNNQDANRTQLNEKPKQINRGFIYLPGTNNDMEKINREELIDDPSIIFDEYLVRKSILMKAYGDDFWEKMENIRLSGIYNFNSTIYQLLPSSKVKFIMKSNSQSELALPILAKIKNKELILTDYRLEYGHFEALKAAFQIEPDILNKVTLNNCGIDDTNFNCLLEGCKYLNSIIHIQITKGDFGIQSVIQLSNILKRPYCLKSLKLKDVELQPSTQDLLFKTLFQKNYLETLSLANFKFCESSFESFTAYFDKDRQLQELQLNNLTGVRTQSWLNFMQSLSHNKTLRDLDISWNNFIENQTEALQKLQNPYRIFKQVYEKWLKLGTGARWPGVPSLEQLQSTQVKKQDTTKTPGAQRKVLTVPSFSQQQGFETLNREQQTEEDVQEQLKQKQTIQVEKLMKQSIRQSFVIAFMEKAIKKSGKKAPMPPPQPPLQMGSEPFEFASQSSTVVTEAIYKFIRRNTNLQHLNLTKCNLSQVMLARIGLGVKCSQSLMSVHFSDNPGVTAALKAYLQVKLKAVPPQVPTIKISNQFIESNSKLHEQIADQMEKMKADQSLPHETIAIREINKSRYDGSYKPIDLSSQESKTLIFTRLLGHKQLIPKSGQWKILISQKHECWICQKYVYSLFFWSPKQISQHQVSSKFLIDKDKIISKLDVEEELSENPLLYAKFTNWQPLEMKLVSEFAEIHRPAQPPSFLQMVKNMFNLPDTFEYLDLIPDQRQVLMTLKEEYYQTTKDNWRQHIGAYMRFKDPQLVNYEYLTYNDDETVSQQDDLQVNPIYVCAALVKPGKHYYLVKQGTKKEETNYDSDWSDKSIEQSIIVAQQQNIAEQFYLHKSIIPLREQPLPLMQKRIITSEAERTFDLDSSVFKAWKPDNNQSIQRLTKNDLIAMNLHKLVKEEDEMVKLEKAILKYMPFLKCCHLDLVAQSNIPPYVTYLDFINFYKVCKLADDNLKAASIDLIYVQVDTNVKTRQGINRGEFVEALIRIAKAKYKDTDMVDTLDEAFEKLVEEDLKPNCVDSEWHKTRVNQFWTIEVNDALEFNLEGLQKVFAMFYDLKAVVKKKWMDLKEADYFFTQSMPDLKITINTCRKCFFFAKMTCVDEQTKIDSYNKIVFVEFLEMLCRIALYHYDDTIYETLPFIQKLEMVLDNVLAVKQIERKPVVIETVIDSDADISDEDY